MSLIPADVLDDMRLFMMGGACFTVCAVLLIVMRKKTVPYIGAMASLAVLLLGNTSYYNSAYIFWGMFVVYCGEPPAFIYIAIALSAAAVTLYWWTRREGRGA